MKTFDAIQAIPTNPGPTHCVTVLVLTARALWPHTTHGSSGRSPSFSLIRQSRISCGRLVLLQGWGVLPSYRRSCVRVTAGCRSLGHA